MKKLLLADGVEFRELREVAGYSDTKIEAKKVDATNFVGVDNLLSSKKGKVDAKYLPNDIRLTKYEQGDILLGNIRPYLQKIWLAKNAGGCSGDVLAVRIKEEYKNKLKYEFLYYLISSDEFFLYNTRHAKGGKMPRGDKARILEYKIPIPPLVIQNEIVKILDNFVKLQAELQAELQARKIQYEYYRNALLTFPDSGQRTADSGQRTADSGQRMIMLFSHGYNNYWISIVQMELSLKSWESFLTTNNRVNTLLVQQNIVKRILFPC